MRREQGRFSGKTRDGNRWLRRTLYQGAWAVTRVKDCDLAAWFRPMSAHRGMKRTVMAVAHSMFIIAYTMLKTGHNYQELGGSYLDQINGDQLQQYFTKTIRRLGFTVNLAPVA
jgi:hypothetical protein